MLLIFIGDAINLNSGLARICRDLMEGVQGDIEASLLSEARLVQIGVRYDDSPQAWKIYHADSDSYGADRVARVIGWDAEPAEEVIIITVMDPARCFGILEEVLDGRVLNPERVKLAGYFAIDAHNIHEKVGGPAARVLDEYNYILAYGKYGARIISNSLSEKRPVQWLPHGIDKNVFNSNDIGVDSSLKGNYFSNNILDWLGESLLIGAVATSQPRKDWGLAFAAFEKLSKSYKYHNYGLKFWVHIDELITPNWSIPELASIYGLNNEKLLVTQKLSEDRLAFMYRMCSATFAPGLGEGFGYPILESLACGTPVVGIDYAGGSELIPRANWRVPYYMQRIEGAYGLVRPVVEPVLVVGALERAIDFSLENTELSAEYCSKAVEHLNWVQLWPRWRSWFKLIMNALSNESKGGAVANNDKQS